MAGLTSFRIRKSSSFCQETRRSTLLRLTRKKSRIDPPADARIVQEECFGPALPVFRVKDLDDAITQANSSQYGLGSSIWTSNLGKAREAAERIEAGYTWINNLHVAYDELPFGGFKQSGYGKEHGVEALDYYMESKSIVIANG